MMTLSQVTRQLAVIPDGQLHIRTDRKEAGYYYRYSHWGKRFEWPIPQELQERARQLDDERMRLEEEFKRVLLSVPTAQAKQAVKYIKEQRRQQLARIIADHRPYKERYIYYTPHGDYVSSKSEALISMLLMQMKIKFHYELPLKVGEHQYYHPDFTLYINGQVYYYEHLGKMQDPEYISGWKKRLEMYHSMNIWENDRLFITQENGTGLDLMDIARQLRKVIQAKI
ncbi:MAG: hypothetical protein IJ315_06955 [Firmicutes bacterium]|nr:hypothetical protein [Bacillota bacterium]